ncbi:MAG: 1-acyl-sn-glycerol-3-phosphate acyltransferase [Sphaerochaetaceae bacterium]|nr:1-acyl-sn-glycerol-3-phosphate acyltransferase [Sphaerochaetaceae bacterium]
MGHSKSLLNSFFYHVARLVTGPMVKKKYSFTTDRIPKLREPFIMLSNHTTEDDMLFTGMASKQHMTFVCGEHLLRNKTYGKPLRLLINPIPLPKGGASLSALKEIIERSKNGENICMFPEGKRSFHGETIPASNALGKLVKKAGSALVTYRIQGGYFTYPRWARDHHRKGHVEGKVMGIYSSEELKNKTAEEITEIINRDTYENAYVTQRQKMWTYTGDNKAKGMEHILFICPQCSAIDTIKTEGDDFYCTECSLKGKYNNYGFLEGEDLPFDNIHSWMRWTEEVFDNYVQDKSRKNKSKRSYNTALFTEENTLLYKMEENYENTDILTDTLNLYSTYMEIGDRKFNFNDISYLSILYGNIVLFTHKDTYYGLTGENLHAWKCARLWHIVKGDTAVKSKEI